MQQLFASRHRHRRLRARTNDNPNDDNAPRHDPTPLMRQLLGLSQRIDALTTFVGRAMSWVAIAMVVVGVYNVLARYAGAQLGMQLSSNALLEAQTQAFDLIFLLGAAYLLRCDGHIRVDIAYAHAGARARAWIDLVGGALLLVPFCGVVLWFSWGYVARSWSRLEVSPYPGGLALYPIKTVILVAFALLLLQGVSEVIKRAAWLRGVPGVPGPHASAQRPSTPERD